MKETKIEIPAGCEVEKVETKDDSVIVTFKEKKPKFPKSWEDFCEMFPKYGSIFYINDNSEIKEIKQVNEKRFVDEDKTIFSDRATAEAVLSLCQLIQLRNCYNGDWVPDWKNQDEIKYVIQYEKGEIEYASRNYIGSSPLYFKSEDLRDEFLRNFRPLIEKLKPLYGIKEGCYECN